MTPHQIELVQDSFVHVVPLSEETAAAFYERLFQIAPGVRRMFADDLTEQGRKLMLTLTVIVDGLDRIDQLLPIARELAVRHVRYGAREAHYDAVGMALLDTLKVGLGPRWTEELAAAWGAAYQLLAGAMIEAARKAA
ncbi:globin domain-containing protein [Sphingomonas donggukensis]|uniref:Globin domain-containing protein n=1 Tax=Sphingomonas donggukensis TaxID=2949093 RepID=A0ABY4TU21_9SPHN|nr:globin family protein [Sphingomonas donggukensis]URW75772.1 globin domain-containing protein [Sphingomonas donggukensis]